MSYYTDRMEQLKLSRMKRDHPEWIWNRSDKHIFLKTPEAHDAFATVVEPGNSFSPGPVTYGVSVWVRVDDCLYAPEEMDESVFVWRFEEDKYPISNCSWKVGGLTIDTSLFTKEVKKMDYRDYFRIALQNDTESIKSLELYIVIHSYGAAGGPITKLEADEKSISINGVPSMFMEKRGEFGAISFADSGQDICDWLKRGEFPKETSVEDASTWASGALRYKVVLKPHECEIFDSAYQIHAECSLFTWIKPMTLPLGFDLMREKVKKEWDKLTEAEFVLPDERINQMYRYGINHIYMACGKNAPHISPITYPAVWTRDSTQLCAVLDQAGLHEFCGRSAAYMAKYKTTGGFGHEADLFGSRILSAGNHYLYTRDRSFLEKVYPYIKDDAEDIIRMCNNEEPMDFPNELHTHRCSLEPADAFACAPVIKDELHDGLCIGRMDYYYCLFYVNSLHHVGLRRAAKCAGELGYYEDARRYTEAADRIRTALNKAVPGHFCHPWHLENACAVWQTATGKEENNTVPIDHDTSVPFYPGEWADPSDENLKKEFAEYWNKQFMREGKRWHEPRWTYFEVGDAVNRLLLGDKENAWDTMDYYLGEGQFISGMYAYNESDLDENSNYLSWEKVRGWDKAPCVTPHGWTSSLLMLFARFSMAYENLEKSRLILGMGVKEDWMKEAFAVRKLATFYGELSYSYHPDTREVIVELNETEPCEIVSAFPGDVRIRRKQDVNKSIERP